MERQELYLGVEAGEKWQQETTVNEAPLAGVRFGTSNANAVFSRALRRELRRALPREQWPVLDRPVVQEASPRRENV